MIDPVPFLDWAAAHQFQLSTGGAGIPAAGYAVAKLRHRQRQRAWNRADLVFGREAGTRRKVGITWEDARHHIRIRGLTGMGKSILLENLVLQAVKAGYGAVVIDPVGGELVDALMHSLPAGTPIAVIDPADGKDPKRPEWATGFNPWASIRQAAKEMEGQPLAHVHITQDAERLSTQWVALMKALYASDWGGKLEGTLHVACLTLIATPGATPTDIPLLLARDSDAFRKHALSHYRTFYAAHIASTLDEFWNGFDDLNDQRYAEKVEPLTHKFTRMLQTHLVSLLGQSQPKGDPFDLIDKRGVLMVKARIGQIDEGPGRVLCSLVAYEAWKRFLARPLGHRPNTLFVFDEAGEFIKGPLAKMIKSGLTLGRKLGCCCTFAYQNDAQLDKETTSVIDNARTEILLTSGKKDASGEGELKSSDLPAHFAIVNRHARGGHVPAVKVHLTRPAEPSGAFLSNLNGAREAYAERLEKVWVGIETRRSRYGGEGKRTNGGVYCVRNDLESREEVADATIKPQVSGMRLPTHPTGAAAKRLEGKSRES